MLGLKRLIMYSKSRSLCVLIDDDCELINTRFTKHMNFFWNSINKNQNSLTVYFDESKPVPNIDESIKKLIKLESNSFLPLRFETDYVVLTSSKISSFLESIKQWSRMNYLDNSMTMNIQKEIASMKKRLLFFDPLLLGPYCVSNQIQNYCDQETSGLGYTDEDVNILLSANKDSINIFNKILNINMIDELVVIGVFARGTPNIIRTFWEKMGIHVESISIVSAILSNKNQMYYDIRHWINLNRLSSKTNLEWRILSSEDIPKVPDHMKECIPSVSNIYICKELKNNDEKLKKLFDE